MNDEKETPIWTVKGKSVNTATTKWWNFSIQRRQIISIEVAREKLLNIPWNSIKHAKKEENSDQQMQKK